MLINARSLVNKVDILKSRVVLDNPDVIDVTETWAYSHISDSELKIDGYSALRKDRSNAKRGGGVLLYIKDNIPFEQLEINLDLESIWRKVGNSGSHCKLGLFYNPPNSSAESIDNMCKEITEKATGKTIILGDFNFTGINWETYASTKIL